MRVVSLLPSTTEIVCALGMREALAGVSHECDWPQSVQGVPVVTSTKLSVGPSSAAIDQDVRHLLRQALAVYDLDIPALERIAPDVILTQDLCDVCAVSYDDVCSAAKTLGNPELRIVSLHPTRLDEVLSSFVEVGEALGVASRARELVASLRSRMNALSTSLEALPRPGVLTIEWLDPVMIGGMWMPELVELAGGKPLVTRPGEHAPTLSREQLTALDPAPDVVIIKPCGFSISRTLQEADGLRETLRGMPWPAVENQRVYVTDGNAYFNRPGPRIAESLEIMATCVHPGAHPDLETLHREAVQRFSV